MKVWSTENNFDHQWDVVVKALMRKYPNEFNTNVQEIDVLDRHVDSQGRLHSARIIGSQLSMPGFLKKVIGNQNCYALEYSVIDANTKTVEMKTVNLSFGSAAQGVERITYTPHPNDHKRTQMKQEAFIYANYSILSSQLENMILNSFQTGSIKGKQAIDHIISNVNLDGLAQSFSETLDDIGNGLSDAALTTIDGISGTLHRSWNMRDLSRFFDVQVKNILQHA